MTPRSDARDYLDRIGRQGAERSWLVDQVASLGHPPEVVSAALSVLVTEGRARRGVADDGTTAVVLPRRVAA